ncbi:MAG TPA: helix-turn-helix domain-containing protein, partial [Pyrinomonadaceae bacterium]|nr:helix-turn-helix domain-containing protein [Pyrinomonadaceae bacterium]
RSLSPGYRASERGPSSGSGNQRFRSILMLDSAPAAKLRVNFNDVSKRAALERRKLREMIEFCYTEFCYRGHILDYFGDRHQWRQCGSCGNCAPSARRSAGRSLTSSRQPRTAPPVTPRPLNEEETLRVRKILACSARMEGRFGKQLLAATLRGSAAKNVMQAHLNELSTYGLLKEMRQEDLLAYIEALVNAGCLQVSPGEYPTVSLTEMGGRVMREQEQVALALSERDGINEGEFIPPKTAFETYALYCRGLSIDEIAQQRNLVTTTIESHLLDCIRAGKKVDISKFVSGEDRKQIERAIAEHGTGKLRPIRDSVPETISYSMIRFVVAEHIRSEKS